MKLFYYQFPAQRYPKGLSNFGDDLNPWLWQRLIPEYLNDDPRQVFVGIGTLLNRGLSKRFASTPHLIVFSSGLGYGGGLPAVTPAWRVYCVRGPLTAQALGLPDRKIATDGGALVRQVFQPAQRKRFRYSFMPHVEHADLGGRVWNKICDRIGFHYIDPRWPVETVLTAIGETEVLLTEAMHGAIAADAFGIPWIPIRTSSRVLTFKWEDWCGSLGMAYEPQTILPLWDLYRFAPGVRSSLRYCTDWFKQDRLRSARSLLADPAKSVSTQLVRIAKSVRPALSDRKQLSYRIEQLEEHLHQFRTDVQVGRFD